MKLKYSNIRTILSGTPLASLTDDQLKEHLIGEYPLIYSSKMLKKLWEEICLSDNILLKQVRVELSISILSEFKTLSIAKGRLDTSEQLESVINDLRGIIEKDKMLLAQSKVIRDQELAILQYEIKIRDLQKENKTLKKTIQ